MINKVLSVAQELIGVTENKFELETVWEPLKCYANYDLASQMYTGDPCINVALKLQYNVGIHVSKLQSSYRTAFYFMLAAAKLDLFSDGARAVATGGSSLLPTIGTLAEVINKLSSVYTKLETLLLSDLQGPSREYESFYQPDGSATLMYQTIACSSLPDAIYMRGLAHLYCIDIVDKVKIVGCIGSVACDYPRIMSRLNDQELRLKAEST